MLYCELKNCIAEYFTISKEDAIDLIQKIIIRESVLKELFSGSKYDAFNMNTKISKTDTNYGNPKISLLSYFQFFEEPAEKSHDESKEEEDITKDWLKYNGIDSFSTTMKLKNNIVFIELRSFSRILYALIKHMADSALNKELEEGACTRIMHNKKSNERNITIKALKMFAKLYEQNRELRPATSRARLSSILDKPQKTKRFSILGGKTHKKQNKRCKTYRKR
jgi:hypothetical protein